jgi:8-oxo-dGTP pyrophosphatase MutT (NUDIX family)
MQHNDSYYSIPPAGKYQKKHDPSASGASTEDSSRDIFCTNCQKYGHSNKRCHSPMESYGVVATRFKRPMGLFLWLWKHNMLTTISPSVSLPPFAVIQSQIKEQDTTFLEEFDVLMIRRKHSFSYVEWVRGKYGLQDIPYITYLLQTMSNQEITNIQTMDFESAWRDLWSIAPTRPLEDLMQHKEYLPSKKKWDTWRQGFLVLHMGHQQPFQLSTWIQQVRNESIEEPEWGYPKGRRDMMEEPMQTARREFAEETNLSANTIHFYSSIFPQIQHKFEFVEDYFGSDQHHYKLHYYPAFYIPPEFNRWIEQHLSTIQLICISISRGETTFKDYPLCHEEWSNYVFLDPAKGDNSYYEISKINWVSYQDHVAYIRSYDILKKSLYQFIHTVIGSFHTL